MFLAFSPSTWLCESTRQTSGCICLCAVQALGNKYVLPWNQEKCLNLFSKNQLKYGLFFFKWLPELDILGNSLLSQSNWLQPSNASCPLLGWCRRDSCHMHGVALLYFPLTNLLRKLTAHALSQEVVWTILSCLCHLLSRIIVSNWLVLVPPATTKGIYHNNGTNELYGQSSANSSLQALQVIAAVWGETDRQTVAESEPKGYMISDFNLFCLTWGLAENWLHSFPGLCGVKDASKRGREDLKGSIHPPYGDHSALPSLWRKIIK